MTEQHTNTKSEIDIDETELKEKKKKLNEYISSVMWGNNTFFLFEVVSDNEFFGRKFVTHKTEVPLFNVREIMESEGEDGFIITSLAYEEIEGYAYGIPKDIAGIYQYHSDYFKLNPPCLKGTIMAGPHKGMEFSLIGKHDIEIFFKPLTIDILKKRNFHYHFGCKFQTIDIKEARSLKDALTSKIRWDCIKANVLHHPIKVIPKEEEHPFYCFIGTDFNEALGDRYRVLEEGETIEYGDYILAPIEDIDLPLDYLSYKSVS